MTEDPKIYVAEPAFRGNEGEYVRECVETGWVSSAGRFVERFEEEFASFAGVSSAVACSSGTSALHLSLLALDVGPGDEVIVPDLSFIATANAVRYCGAEPVFVDVDPDTWNIDPELIEPKISDRTAAIVPVHLYGHPADMDAISSLADEYNMAVIEDAAEAHGARHGGLSVGGIGDAGVFSFYGNKIITTGEGGMLTTNDDEVARKVRLLRGQGTDERSDRYVHSVVGYNYRMTNLQAAVGLGQLENIDWHLARRGEVAAWYRELLSGVEGLRLPPDEGRAESVCWMFNVVLVEPCEASADCVGKYMRERGVETRPFFYPLHAQPPYRSDQPSRFPVSERLRLRGITLPTHANLDRNDVERVTAVLREAMQVCGD